MNYKVLEERIAVPLSYPVFNGHSSEGEGHPTRKEVGVNDAEGPPVPIPNTEVKLCRAHDTWLATARKNRQMPTR